MLTDAIKQMTFAISVLEQSRMRMEAYTKEIQVSVDRIKTLKQACQISDNGKPLVTTKLH